MRRRCIPTPFLLHSVRIVLIKDLPIAPTSTSLPSSFPSSVVLHRTHLHMQIYCVTVYIRVWGKMYDRAIFALVSNTRGMRCLFPRGTSDLWPEAMCYLEMSLLPFLFFLSVLPAWIFLSSLAMDKKNKKKTKNKAPARKDDLMLK